MGRRHDGHRFDNGVDAEVGAGEFGDVGQLGLEHLGAEVRAVEQHVIFVRSGAATLGHLLHHAARNDVARREVFDGWGVTLHEALAATVAQNSSFAARALGQQDTQPGEPGRVELEELHVFERNALAPDDADAVARQGVRVRRRLVDLAETAGGEDDALGVKHVQVAGGELVGNDACGLTLGHHEVEHVVLVVELDAQLDAVLKQGLQNHVSGAVGRVAGPAYRRLAVVARVPAEAPLVDLAVGRAVERQPHVLEVDDRVDCLFRENFGRVLVNEVVATFDRVEGVPFPAVFFDVREGGGHAALRRAGVRPRRVQLRDDGRLGVGSCLDGSAHAGAAGTDDHNVELVLMHRGHCGRFWCCRRRGGRGV